jgi:hypothetical protein
MENTQKNKIYFGTYKIDKNRLKLIIRIMKMIKSQKVNKQKSNPVIMQSFY